MVMSRLTYVYEVYAYAFLDGLGTHTNVYIIRVENHW